MSRSIDFLSRFDETGRFRDGDGTVDVVFLTNRGAKIPGRLEFKDGLCIRADMHNSNWAYPDGSPLNGLRLLLQFESEEPLVVLLERGRVLTLDMVQSDGTFPDIPDTLGGSKIVISPRARTALESMPTRVQQEVIVAVAKLAAMPPVEWPHEDVPQLSSDKPVYLLRLSPELRAFIRVTDDNRVELFDIVPEAILSRFLEPSKAKTGSS